MPAGIARSWLSMPEDHAIDAAGPEPVSERLLDTERNRLYLSVTKPVC